MGVKREDFEDLIKLSDGRTYKFYSLKKLESMGYGNVSRLPYSLRIMLESILRNMDGRTVTEDELNALLEWSPERQPEKEVPLVVSRILMQDFTGVPALVDLAAMRDYVKSKGLDPKVIEPGVPVDLIIDHSVQVDSYNSQDSFEVNLKNEIERNAERYRFLKWAAQAFNSLRIFPPSAGICHQINLEYLAKVVMTKGDMAFFDSLVGTDSHTTMINGIGVLGFGVGGVEAEAAMLGQPIYMLAPQVVGVRLKGELPDAATATDLALTVTKVLRERNVVGKFVEFFGEGVRSLSVPDRATVSNMSPEYGSTISIFPVDDATLEYLKLTGRGSLVELVRKYYEAQGIFGGVNTQYSEVIELDMSEVKPMVSGPSQPKQAMELENAPKSFAESFKPQKNTGELKDGDVVIAAITSCTNTSNPYVLISAGLLAKKAYELGLKVNTSKVKTSLAPGSRAVTEYLRRSGLLEYLEKLGFYVVAYGCTTCIGNSGPLPDNFSSLVNEGSLAVVSVLSGNRNYAGRIHNDVRANYLMSPPLVVAYAIAGSILKDLTKDPLGYAKDGRPVYLKDVWPTRGEVLEYIKKAVTNDVFESVYGKGIFSINRYWNELNAPKGEVYEWDERSTYIRKPPFLEVSKPGERKPLSDILNARVLLVLGDSISTDHISPAGAIMPDSPAGRYLKSLGVDIVDFNTYGARRGNHEVMVRGTFANRQLRNLMLDNVQGGYTIHFPDGKVDTVYDVAMKYINEGVPTVIIAGKEYGSGSSRDWAAKGPFLLGVKAVIAESFERIHRSNLVEMGIIPLQFMPGEGYSKLGIDFTKPISIRFLEKRPRGRAVLEYYRKDGSSARAELAVRIDTQLEMDYVESGGIMQYVMNKIINEQ